MLFLGLVQKMVVELETIGLVEIGQPSIALEADLHHPEKVEIEEVEVESFQLWLRTENISVCSAHENEGYVKVA
jgi:hypothetical protein